MKTLFDTDEPAAPPEPGPDEDLVAAVVEAAKHGPDLRLTADEVRAWSRRKALAALELIDKYGRHPHAVRDWSVAKCETVVAKCRKDAARAHNHARASAEKQEPAEPNTGPNLGELTMRLTAALCLEEALAEGKPESLLFALTYAMHPLVFAELVDAAGLVIQQLRLHPVTGERLEFPPQTEAKT